MWKQRSNDPYYSRTKTTSSPTTSEAIFSNKAIIMMILLLITPSFLQEHSYKYNSLFFPLRLLPLGTTIAAIFFATGFIQKSIQSIGKSVLPKFDPANSASHNLLGLEHAAQDEVRSTLQQYCMYPEGGGRRRRSRRRFYFFCFFKKKFCEKITSRTRALAQWLLDFLCAKLSTQIARKICEDEEEGRRRRRRAKTKRKWDTRRVGGRACVRWEECNARPRLRSSKNG